MIEALIFISGIITALVLVCVALHRMPLAVLPWAVVLVVLAITSPAFAGKSAAQKQWGGSDISYSCATIRWAWNTFDHDWLERMAKARGITPKQRRQAKACLKGVA